MSHLEFGFVPYSTHHLWEKSVKYYEKAAKDWEKAIERTSGNAKKQRRKRRNPPLKMIVEWRGYSEKRKE